MAGLARLLPLVHVCLFSPAVCPALCHGKRNSVTSGSAPLPPRAPLHPCSPGEGCAAVSRALYRSSSGTESGTSPATGFQLGGEARLGTDGRTGQRLRLRLRWEGAFLLTLLPLSLLRRGTAARAGLAGEGCDLVSAGGLVMLPPSAGSPPLLTVVTPSHPCNKRQASLVSAWFGCSEAEGGSDWPSVPLGTVRMSEALAPTRALAAPGSTSVFWTELCAARLGRLARPHLDTCFVFSTGQSSQFHLVSFAQACQQSLRVPGPPQSGYCTSWVLPIGDRFLTRQSKGYGCA